MKHLNKTMLCILLALTLILGAMALAETAQAPAPEAIPGQTEPAEAPEEAPADDDSAALQDAIDAYHSAQQESRQAERRTALEEELNGYVEAGKLTQEQADLILNEFDARAEARANGPQKQSRGRARGGHMNGMMNNGGNDRMGGRMNNGGNDRMGGQSGRMGGRMNGRGGQAPMAPAAPQAADPAPDMPQPEMGPDGI